MKLRGWLIATLIVIVCGLIVVLFVVPKLSKVQGPVIITDEGLKQLQALEGELGDYSSGYEKSEGGFVRKGAAEKRISSVEVFYATDRKRTDSKKFDQLYGVERNLETPGNLEYGKGTITIPFNHEPGTVERPKWWKFEFKEDPEKHVVLQEPELMDEAIFYDSIREHPASELLMFVHGFNVRWGDAMRRTGQISHDLGFEGITFCYSWPSQGNTGKYQVDRQNSEWAFPHLGRILIDLQTKAQVGKVHIIAHSMGTVVLSKAIKEARESGVDLNLSNIILAAPDIDRDIFETYLPKFSGNIDRLTLYASSDDAALKISQKFNGSPRVGMSGANLFVKPDQMDTIDASGIDTSLLGHSYYGSHKIVLSDIGATILKGLIPANRSLKQGPVGEWNLPSADEFEAAHLKATGRDYVYAVMHPNGHLDVIYSGDIFEAFRGGEKVNCELIVSENDEVLIVIGDEVETINLKSDQEDSTFKVRKIPTPKKANFEPR